VSQDSTLADPEAREGVAPGDGLGSGDPTLGLDEGERDAELARLHRRRGETLGRYVLLEPIGRGGMGVVYSAYDPELDRRIALKLLRSEEDEHGRARLLREAQAMAKLVHPNVIAVHDVGTFAGGVFVAMELVDGMDLRRWLAAGPHTWREVLAVFEPAGRGLLAAHRAGLVHRDFKPANVLLGKGGEVKVVDFGLARQLGTGLDTSELRALERRLAVDSATGGWDEDLTGSGTLVGTPAYMAPEQHTRQELDARSDQFSYCVALYEALFTKRPFEGDGRMALAVQTNRGDVQPPPRGHAVPAHLVRAVLRGLRPKPAERFVSMVELLAELAYDPGRRRRRIGAGVAAALLLAVGTYGYVRTPSEAAPRCAADESALAGVWDDAQRDALSQAFAKSDLPYASDTARFVSGRLDAWGQRFIDAHREACEATHVAHTQPESLLELRRLCLARQRKDLAAVTRLLVEGQAETIEHADRMVASLPAPDACGDAEALGRLAPPADPHTAAAVDAVLDELSEVRALRHAGRYREGLSRAERAQASAEQTGYGPLLAEALLELGDLQNRVDQPAQADETLHAAARAATLARHDEVLAGAWLTLAWNLGMGQSHHDEGLRWAAYAEAVIDRMGRPDGPRAELLCTQGSLRWAKGELELALERQLACLELRERTMPGDPLVANAQSYVGNTQIQLGRYEAGAAAFQRGLEVATAALGPMHPLVSSMHNGLGVAHYHRNRLADAELEFQRAYDIDVEVLGPEHPDLLYSLGNIAGCRRDRGEYAAALAAMRRVEALVHASFPPEHREVGLTAHNVAELLALQGQHEAALAEYEHALAVRTKVHGPDDPYVANTLTGRAELLLTLSRAAEARADLERALAIREGANDPQRHDYGRTRFALARALWQTGGDRTRARQLAEAARGDLAEADSPLARGRRAALAAWLAEHAAPGEG
jgi:eukaryotic-like serine/threonine-protein kinase